MSGQRPGQKLEYDLVLKAQAGEADAQKEIFERFAGKMMTVCRRYARHELEAEDILQDSFIKVFRKLDQFSFNGSFEGWIRKIVVNTALKCIKKKGFQMEQHGLENIPEESVHPGVFSKLSEEELLKLIQELPIGYRTVFNLYALEGFSHKEISEQLEIGESTSRSQLVKARRMLQKMVKDLYRIAV